jgi:hypothetical protein
MERVRQLRKKLRSRNVMTLPDRRVLVTADFPLVRDELVLREAAEWMAAPDPVGPQSAPSQMTGSPRVRMEEWRAGGPEIDRELT